MLKLGFILFLSVFVFGDALKTITSHLDGDDNLRLNAVFQDGLKSSDLQSIYYSSSNLKDHTKEQKTGICGQLNSLYTESKLNAFEKNFYLVGTHSQLGCSEAIQAAIQSAIKSSLAKDTTTSHELYFNYFANKFVGNTIDEATKTRIVTNLQTILKADDSLSNLGSSSLSASYSSGLGSLGYAFNIAADLGSRASALSKWIETTLAQADEVDGKLLQFEGGLSITSWHFQILSNSFINGIFKFSKATSTPVPLTEDQILKFTAYFLSRRLVQQAKGASVLLESLETIAAEKKLAPICIAFVGNGLLQPDAQILNVKVLNVLGKPLQPAVSSVTASVLAKGDSVALGSKLAFTVKSSDKTEYALDLKSLKLARGSYALEITADSYKQSLNFKVLGKVKVSSLEIGVGESDSASAIQKQTIAYPNKLSSVLNADQQQKILLKTLLVDETTNKPISVHQAFILFKDQSQREIIFVAEQDTSKAYKFDLDIGARSVFFNHRSGVYALELIVGDASLANSFRWHLADIELKFSEKESSAPSVNASRSPRPEIIHQFREPEVRPSRFVSDVFTALCAAPLLVLLFLWSKIGINISASTFSLTAIGFHLCFGAILGLFGLFWLQLNMFDTLRLLIPLSIVTFILGNRFLRSLAAKTKTE